MQPYPEKDTPADASIIDPIKNRWSPLAFDPTPLKEEEIALLFEAARWAPSCFGEQPWRYIYACKGDDEREVLESLLNEGNSWAKHAGLLILGFAKKAFDKNGKPNRYYLYDTGAATGMLTIQATSMGLITHQMAGFDAEHANEMLGVPDAFEPAAMIAVGYPGDPSVLSDVLRERQEKPRSRLPRTQIAMRGSAALFTGDSLGSQVKK